MIVLFFPGPGIIPAPRTGQTLFKALSTQMMIDAIHYNTSSSEGPTSMPAHNSIGCASMFRGLVVGEL